MKTVIFKVLLLIQKQARMSPTTINVGIQKLSNLGLIEQIKNRSPMKIKPEHKVGKKTTGMGPGRPKKRHKLTERGKEVYKEQKRLKKKK